MPSGLVYPMSMHTIITKLYVSKQGTNPDKNTRETHQTTIFSQKLLPDVTRWRHDIVMVLTHIFMLSVICKTVKL